MRIVTMMMVTMWSNILYFHFRRNLATKGFWGFAQNVILELKGRPLSIIWIICFICWDIEEQVRFVLRAKQEIILLSFPFNSLNLSKMENPLNFTSSLLTPGLWLHFAQRPIPLFPSQNQSSANSPKSAFKKLSRPLHCKGLWYQITCHGVFLFSDLLILPTQTQRTQVLSALT